MMWQWLRKWLFGQAGEADDVEQVKDFHEESAQLPPHQYLRQGVRSIKTDKIIGSVGRAHELDREFRYRKRMSTGRYHSIDLAQSEGKPTNPIKVVRVKRGREQSEYYVMDGHHRVANAKRNQFDEMNADVTDVIWDEENQQHDQT